MNTTQPNTVNLLKIWSDTEFSSTTMKVLFADPNLLFVDKVEDADVVLFDRSTLSEHLNQLDVSKKYVFMYMDTTYAIPKLPPDIQVINPHLVLPENTFDIPEDWGQGHIILGRHVWW